MQSNTNPELAEVYSKLKDTYCLTLTTGLQLDAGFSWEVPVLTGKSDKGTFYLYDEGAGMEMNYDTEAGIHPNHWHPEDVQQMVRLVAAFMDGKSDYEIEMISTEHNENI
jgi:hypothetical protein